MVQAGGILHPLSDLGTREAIHPTMRRPLLSVLLAAGGAVLVCALLLSDVRGQPSALLDKEAAEIAKLQGEKASLEHSLTTGRMPLMHPTVRKSELRRAAQLKVNVQEGKQWATVPVPAMVQKLSQSKAAKPVHPTVQALEQERAALEQRIQSYKTQASKQKQPLGGILAAYTEDTGAGVLSRTSTLQAENQGLLGRVGENRYGHSDNVLGSLAATMTKEQQAKMLKAEHVKQLDDVKTAMGDVTPKEALAQRIISLGVQFLAEKDTAPHQKGPAPASEAVKREHARGRVAQMHHKFRSHGSHAVHVKAQDARKSTSGVQTHSQAVSAAKQRVELLRRELKEAENVAQLQKQLHDEQAQLDTTHSQEAGLKRARSAVHTQNLVALLPGADEGANEKFVNANEEIHKFVGQEMGDEDNDAEDETEPTMEARFNKEAHGEGYVKGALYVGSAEAGPDRYGQDGAGPQVVKGKLGDNFVDVGLMGASGTLEGDVMVPTKLSGARHRDRPQDNDPKKMSLGHVDEQTSNDLVKGSIINDFGGEQGLQMDDKSVPITNVAGALFRDRARTEDLAQTDI